MTLEPPKITIVYGPGSVQTYIENGDRAIARSDPARYGLTVMNEIVGGGPQSRLFVDLGEESTAIPYGAYSRVDAKAFPIVSAVFSRNWLGVIPVTRLKTVQRCA